MKIYKEKEVKNPLYVTRLDNGVELLVYDGYAEGNDGKIYYPAIKEFDDEIEFLGWGKISRCVNLLVKMPVNPHKI